MYRAFKKTRTAAAVFAAMAVAVATFAVPAGAEDSSGGQTIADTAIAVSSLDGFDSDNDDFDILIHALQAADLVGAVADPSADLTVFAPTDQAFVRLARDLGFSQSGYNEAAATEFIVAALTELGGGDPIPVLTDVLLYHVSPGSTSYADSLRGEVTEINTLLGATFTAEGRTLVDAAPAIEDGRIRNPQTDIAASNGVIHGVSRVLLPVPLEEMGSLGDPSAPTIADTVVAVSSTDGFDSTNDDFDILLHALVATDLVDAVADPSAELTVFAPTDQGFVNLARDLGFDAPGYDEEAAVDFLGALFTELGDGDPIPVLTDVLLFHVAPGLHPYNGGLRGGINEVPTLLGPTFTAGGRDLFDPATGLRNARIRNPQTDIVASNGLIQGLNRVLIPLADLEFNVSDDVIAEQRANLAAANASEPFGPQSGRDIESAIGTNPVTFDIAPPASQLNLCNIHFHEGTEHRGGQFTTYNGNGDGEGHGTGYAFDGDLTAEELSPYGIPVGREDEDEIEPGDTIEVHFVYSSDNITPGPTLGSCLDENPDIPDLRVETQVYVVVNDRNAADFANIAVAEQNSSGLWQAPNMPTGLGEPVQFLGSTTGPGFNEVGSPFQVTWNVAPEVLRVDIASIDEWFAGNIFDEDHAHASRNLVINPELLSPIG